MECDVGNCFTHFTIMSFRSTLFWQDSPGFFVYLSFFFEGQTLLILYFSRSNTRKNRHFTGFSKNPTKKVLFPWKCVRQGRSSPFGLWDEPFRSVANTTLQFAWDTGIFLLSGFSPAMGGVNFRAEAPQFSLLQNTGQSLFCLSLKCGHWFPSWTEFFFE